MQVLRCLVMVDAVDSTAATSRLGEPRVAEFWAAHDRLSRDLLRQWRGREIDRSDGLLGLFDSVADGAGFAAAYHEALARLTPALQARAGLHWCPLALREASAEDRDLGARPLEAAGLGRALVARLCALARPGQTLASAEAAAVQADAGAALQPHGHWRLKGFDEPLAVCELLHPLAPASPPADGEKAMRVHRQGADWVPAAQVPLRLPAERDPFVGRQDELRQLGARLAGDGPRVLTLAGPGGIGKTRLAVRYAHAWRGDHPGGVFFCELASAASADGIVHAVAQALQVPLGRRPVEQLGHAIAGRGRALLVLDNFEQLVGEAPATLARWLEAAPQARFLVTSRERLGLAGEQVLTLDALPAGDARALFRQRAEALGPWADDDRAALDELLQRLDGLPLAIELAAARAGTLTPRAMLDRLDDRFRLLSGPGGRGRPGRQATLRAALDWSWELLSATERATLVQLAVFEGGFSLDAAEAVVRPPDEAAWVPDLVQSLVDKSLVRRIGPRRFDLLRSVQDYAAARAGARSDLAAARARHWAHFAALAQRPETEDTEDLDNLLAACRQATAAGEPAPAARCLAAAWTVLRRCGPFHGVAALAQDVLALPRLLAGDQSTAARVAASALGHLGDASGALAISACALDRPAAPDEPPAERARLLAAAADAAAVLGDAARAEALLAQALALVEAPGADHATGCQVFNALGSAATDRDQRQEAIHWFQRGLALARAAGDRRWQGALLSNLGTQHHGAGDLDAAQALYREALGLSAEVGDRRWEGDTRCNLGLLHFDQGRLDAAAEELGQVLATARQLGLPRLEATAACNLGLVAQAQDDLAGAADRFREALATWRRVGDRRGAAMSCAYLAAALARGGRLEAAAQALADGQALLSGLSQPHTAGLLDAAEVELARRLGEDARADAALTRLREGVAQQGLGPDSELGRLLARLEPAPVSRPG